MLTQDQIVQQLRNAVSQAGGIRPWARANGFAAGHICNVLRGAPVTARLANTLGYAACTRFVPVLRRAA